MKRAKWLLSGLLLVVLLGGLSLAIIRQGGYLLVDADQIGRTDELTVQLAPGQTIGQTFVARHGGLGGVEFFLSPAPDAQGTLVLHLLEGPFSSEDILTSTLSLPADSQEGYYRFAFPAIVSSHSQYYYALLEYTGAGHLEAAVGDLQLYQDGTLYQNGQAKEAQAVFRLIYDPLSIILDLVLMVAGWVAFGIASVAILFFSGYWIMRRWAIQANLDFTATLVWSAAVALAAWMVMLVWSSMLLRLTTWSVWLIVGTSCLLGIAAFTKDRARWRNREFWLGRSPLSTLAFWAIVVLSIGLRLFVVRGMVVLRGIDTYHHTLIVQLFEEQGGIPDSYEPFAPLVSYSYHFGFHSIVALFRWLFGTELLVTTKTVAVILNGAIAAIVGLVSERWAGSRRAGIIAAAAVGLIAVSPFALLRWGRFTQTTGMFFLAAGLLAVTASRKEAGWVSPSLLIAALAISHFRVVLLMVVFAALTWGVEILRGHWKETRDRLILGIASILLAAPWLLRVAWVQYDPDGLRTTLPVLGTANTLQRLEAPVISFITNGPLLAVLALSIAVVWLSGRRLNNSRQLAVWGLVSTGGALVFSLLGIYFFLDVKTTVLSMAVPLGIVVGLAGEALWNAFRTHLQVLVRACTVAGLMVGILAGLVHLPRLLGGVELRYWRQSDLQAMDWIQDNIPMDALFLVDSTTIRWSPGWVMGLDAGYWIPLLAHRSNTVPPMIYPLEWGDSEELTAMLEASQKFLRWKAGEITSLEPILTGPDITHVLVSVRGSQPHRDELPQSSRLREICRLDRIRIYEVLP